MKILVCGDRNWTDYDAVYAALDALDAEAGPVTVISGMARGADTHAANWAAATGRSLLPFPADWKRYGRGAGPVRNQQMLDEGPDLVLAFHDDLAASKGTADMVRRSERAGVEVRKYPAANYS